MIYQTPNRQPMARTSQDRSDPSARNVSLGQGQGSALYEQLRERPWLILGAAVAVGYALGSVGGESSPAVSSGWRGSSSYPIASGFAYRTVDWQRGTAPAQSQPAAYQPNQSQSPLSNDQPEQSQSQDSGPIMELNQEIDLLKQAAITTARNFIRSFTSELLPASQQRQDRQ